MSEAPVATQSDTDTNVKEVGNTIERLSGLASKGAIQFTQAIGGGMLLLAVGDKLTDDGQKVLGFTGSPSEPVTLLICGVLLILGGLVAKIYDQRLISDSALRIQELSHRETLARITTGAPPAPLR